MAGILAGDTHRGGTGGGGRDLREPPEHPSGQAPMSQYANWTSSSVTKAQRAAMVSSSIIFQMQTTSFSAATKAYKPRLLSLRNVAVTAVLPLSLLCAGRAEAVTTIDQTISNKTFSAFANLDFARTPSTRSTSRTFTQLFDKFDTSLGTLLGVRFSGDGDLVGKFRGAKSSNNATVSSLTGGTVTLSLNFPTASWITTSGPAQSFIGASALATTTGTLIGSNGTLLTSTNPNLTLSNSDTSTYLSFFEGSAGDTIESTFSMALNLTSNNLSASGTCSNNVKCTGFNFSPTGTGSSPRLTGDINSFTLSYDYEAFPEETPAPLPILGSGMAFAYTRRLRRRIQKAQFTL